ncbi:MAG: hypothetical protein KatS3mg085_036 [Candidatus Dojkabacteria bacterium]|nr:MAG: hypothetical protein KatS3mg085_036 [Candidatus Dojkabacteria bacterium]
MKKVKKIAPKISIVIALILLAGSFFLLVFLSQKQILKDNQVLKKVILQVPEKDNEEEKTISNTEETYGNKEIYESLNYDQKNILVGIEKIKDAKVKEVLSKGYYIDMKSLEVIKIPKMNIYKYNKVFENTDMQVEFGSDVLDLGLPVVGGNMIPKELDTYENIKKRYEDEGYMILQDAIHRLSLSKDYDVYPSEGPIGLGYEKFVSTYRWNVNVYPVFLDKPIIDTEIMGTIALYREDPNETQNFSHNIIRPIDYDFESYDGILELEIMQNENIKEEFKKGEAYIVEQMSKRDSSPLLSFRLSRLNDTLLPEPTIKYISYKPGYTLLEIEEEGVSYLVPVIVMGGFIQFDELENVDDYYIETYIPIVSVKGYGSI